MAQCRRSVLLAVLCIFPLPMFAQSSDFVRPLDWPPYDGVPSPGYTTVYRGNYVGGSEGSGSHPGVDVTRNRLGEFLTTTSEVRAVSDGTVVRKLVNAIEQGQGWGNALVLKHDGISVDQSIETIYSTYAHLHKFETNPATGVEWVVGDTVGANSLLGYVGATGNVTGLHLHFQIDKDYPASSYPLHPFWPRAKGNDPVNLPDDDMLVLAHTFSPVRIIERLAQVVPDCTEDCLITIAIDATLDGSAWTDTLWSEYAESKITADGEQRGGSFGVSGTPPVVVEQPDIKRMEIQSWRASIGTFRAEFPFFLGALPASVALIDFTQLLHLTDVFTSARPLLTIDGLRNDWQDVPPMIIDPPGDGGAGIDLGAIWTYNDDERFYFLVEHVPGASASSDAISLLIDRDKQLCFESAGVWTDYEIRLRPYAVPPSVELRGAPCTGGALLSSGIIGSVGDGFTEFSIPMSDLDASHSTFNHFQRLRYRVKGGTDVASTNLIPGWESSIIYLQR